VLGQRTVASLAADASMLANLLHLENIGVTALTGLVSSEVDVALGDLADSSSAIVAVLAEALRHNVMANHKEDRERDNEEKGESKEMSCILEEIH
jgi:hypothetical protein